MPFPARRLLILPFVAALVSVSAFAAMRVDVTFDRNAPALAFAAGEIAKAASGSADASALMVSLEIASAGDLGAQAYRVDLPAAGRVRVVGGDAAGAMYGGLDVAEAIRHGTLAQLRAATHTPHVLNRGIKFNIPLDLRTPSYTDPSDAAQANIPEVWKEDFWRDYFDEMARHRYNLLSLWSLHPFPSMVKVPEFPAVALDDVWRTTLKLEPNFSTTGVEYVRPEMLAQHEVVKKITMEQKIEFWRWVMRYAKERGVEIYVFTWNVFTYGAEGKHGITASMDNETTKRYFRATIREMVKTYPLLAGFGITAGEAMPANMDNKIKERWLWDTYGEGVRDALQEDPKRQVRMIHRFHWTAQGEILDAWKDYPGTFEFSFKYSVAHMYSVPNPQFIAPLLQNIAPGRKTWLTLRNDDIYSFRFGDPDYAREYVVNLPPADKMGGFYIGPDGYSLGREFLDRDPGPGPRQLVMQKQWYNSMLWGRLAYDPTLPDSLFQRELAVHFPGADAGQLFRAFQAATQTMPAITRFFWGDIDLKWFPEASLSHPRQKGYYNVRHFVEGTAMPDAGVLDIRQWRANLAARKPMSGRTPLQVADELEGIAATNFAAIAAVRAKPVNNVELRKTLDDCEALAWLARYYAAKIRGACALALFDLQSDPGEQRAALGHLEQALSHWKHYAAIRDGHYLPALYNRHGYVDITALTRDVAGDLEIARTWKPGSVREDAPRATTEQGFRL